MSLAFPRWALRGLGDEELRVQPFEATGFSTNTAAEKGRSVPEGAPSVASTDLATGFAGAAHLLVVAELDVDEGLHGPPTSQGALFASGEPKRMAAGSYGRTTRPPRG